MPTLRPYSARAPLDDVTRSSSDERNRFLVELDDATRPLENPEEITHAAARLLGVISTVNRCAYADVEPDEDTFNLFGDYNAGVPSIVGRYTFSQFGAECLRLMRAGRAATSSRTPRTIPAPSRCAMPTRFARIRSVICVPLRKKGPLRRRHGRPSDHPARLDRRRSRRLVDESRAVAGSRSHAPASRAICARASDSCVFLNAPGASAASNGTS